MNIIPLGLFLLGVIFLIIGWRWKSPRGEEHVKVLKGLAYLRNEISRVEGQVHSLEDEITKTKRLYNKQENQTVIGHKAVYVKKKDHKEAVSKELEQQELERKEAESKKVELKKLELKDTEYIHKAKLYSISPKVQREQTSKVSKKLFDEPTESMRFASESAPQTDHNISGKFREVLELAAHGQCIPEISQRLLISQDAVRMVLSMQSKGGTR